MPPSGNVEESFNQKEADVLLSKLSSVSYRSDRRMADSINYERLPKPTVIIPPHPLTASLRRDNSREEERPRKVQGRSTTVSRRSRRANAAPFNYFSRSNYSGYHSEDNVSVSSTQKLSRLLRRSVSTASTPVTSRRRIKGQYRVVFQNEDLKICRQTIRTLDELEDLVHAPYSPKKSPAHYVRLGESSNLTGILHVAFDRDEITALLSILSYDTSRCLPSKLATADHLIDLLSAIPEAELKSCTRKVMKTLKVRQSLAEHGIKDIEAYLLGLEARSQESPTWLQNKCLRFLTNHFHCNCDGNGPWTEDIRSTVRHAAKCLELSHALRKRGKHDVRSFLSDAKEGRVSTVPYVIKAINSTEVYGARKAASQSLRDREIGCSKSRIEYFSNRLGVSKYWKGASNDVLNLAWSSDGSMFAVGAAAQCDEHNMQYNRNNNLLLGNLELSTLTELPSHRIPHPSTSSTRDPFLYMSVTSVQWSGNQLFTSSYDGTAKVWDISRSTGATCSATLEHTSKVHLMSISDLNLLATATETINVWGLGKSPKMYKCLEIVRPKGGKPVELTPSALAWGLAQSTNRLLATGSCGMDKDNGDPSKEGCLSVWRFGESEVMPVSLTPNSQNIFDLKWHPILPYFATGSSVPTLRHASTPRDTRSVVRLYEPLTCQSRTMEFDCPALDINDVTFCPFDQNYISASCTDGSTYVWDFRNPNKVLQCLKHGEALNPLDERLSREQADVGVRVALWGSSIGSFYTGGSDGALKCWDILRSPDDAHVSDVANLEDELMCGSFSHDKSQLLLGDAAGGVHVLSTSSQSSYPHFQVKSDDRRCDLVEDDDNSGVARCRKLLASGELQRHPTFGVGQGSNYRGPFAAWARPEGTPSESMSMTPLIREIQAIQLDGPPVESRPDLDATAKQTVLSQIRLAYIRNGYYGSRKRKRDDGAVIKIDSDDEKPLGMICSIPRRRRKPMTVGRIGNVEIIDLTANSESDHCSQSESSELPPFPPRIEKRWKEKMIEDHWWPDSGTIDPNLPD